MQRDIAESNVILYHDYLQTDGEFYTYQNPEEHISSTVGIDVSTHQGTIDWQAVRTAGIEFAIIRLGFRGYETGELVVDDRFEENLR